jgi:hypothetical protein
MGRKELIGANRVERFARAVKATTPELMEALPPILWFLFISLSPLLRLAGILSY